MKRLASLILLFFLALALPTAFAQDGNAVDGNAGSTIGRAAESGQDFLADVTGGFFIYVFSKVAWVFSSLVEVVAGFMQISVFRATLLVLVPIIGVLIWKLEWILSFGANTIRWILVFLAVVFFVVGFFGV